MVQPASILDKWTTLGSTIASFMFIWTMIARYCPQELRHFLDRYTSGIIATLFSPYIRISIHEYTSSHLTRSEAYASVEAYLGANKSKSAKKLKAIKGKDKYKLDLIMDENERATDEFNGVRVWWVSSCKYIPRHQSVMPEPEKRYFKLTFHKKDREIVTEEYLEHVMRSGKEIRRRNRQRKLFTNSGNKLGQKQTMWNHISFDHPATFDTMAMEIEKKNEIIEDLLTFSKSKDFYARIGKAWKRGYLLYGPPGTGKSTMIVAMANLLNYDVYDLELTAVEDNTQLRRLLIETTRKSIIVIEDIDCSLDLTGQRKKDKKSIDEKGKKENSHEVVKDESGNRGSNVTLSGLLNFIDGIWSASGGERIIVFTTNYVDKLDHALTRRGRMDKHIQLSYCSYEGFKVLAKNYLVVEEHPLFEKIRDLLTRKKITPADVAENLMPKSASEDAEKCLLNLIQALEEASDEVGEIRQKGPTKALEEANDEVGEIRQKGPAKALEEANDEVGEIRQKGPAKALEEANDEVGEIRQKSEGTCK